MVPGDVDPEGEALVVGDDLRGNGEPAGPHVSPGPHLSLRGTRLGKERLMTLGVDAHQMHVALEAAVREHLIELGELRLRVD